jgi:hypothetical protein
LGEIIQKDLLLGNMQDRKAVPFNVRRKIGNDNTILSPSIIEKTRREEPYSLARQKDVSPSSWKSATDSPVTTASW